MGLHFRKGKWMEKGTTDGILRNGLLEKVTEERGTSRGNDKRVAKEVGRETSDEAQQSEVTDENGPRGQLEGRRQSFKVR